MTSQRSFSNRTEPIVFDVDGEEFTAAPEAPADTLLALAANAEGATGTDQVKLLGDILDMVLLGDSGPRFAARMSDPVRPIGLGVALEVMNWLIEGYTNRPLGPSSPSPASSGNGEASSAAGVSLPAAWTPGP